MPRRTRLLLPVLVFLLVLGSLLAFSRRQADGGTGPGGSDAALMSPAVTSSPAVVPSPPSSSPVPAVTTTAAARPAPHPAASRRATPKPTRTATTTLAAPAVSVKKGAATYTTAGMRADFADSGVSWFYNWSPDDNGISVPGVQFVPMMWGSGSVTAANLATAKREGKVLLGFNEPDMGGQSNLSVDTALSLWPQLQATGMTLGSPAVATGADRAGGWLDRFMTGARAKGYRVDFITLHWYGSDFRSAAATQQLRSYIAATYARYHKPIWVTEYSLINFGGGTKYPSAAQQAAFVTSSTAMLHSLSSVQRYSWFAFPTPTEGGDGTGLYRPDGSRTAAGTAYRAAR